MIISMLVSGKDDGFVSDVDEDDVDGNDDEDPDKNGKLIEDPDELADLDLVDSDDTTKLSVVVNELRATIKAEIHSTMVLTITVVMFVIVVEARNSDSSNLATHDDDV